MSWSELEPRTPQLAGGACLKSIRLDQADFGVHGRDFLESTGVLWFWNYKVRIMKILAKTLRDRPLSALTMMGGVGPLSGVDTVWDGSLLGNSGYFRSQQIDTGQIRRAPIPWTDKSRA